MPRFHGHLKASLQPLSGVIKVTLPIETPVIHVPLSGRVGRTLPHKSYSSLSWEDQTANGHLHGQLPRSGFAVIGPFEPMPAGTDIAPPRCHPPPDGGTVRHVNNSLPGPLSEGSVHGNRSRQPDNWLSALAEPFVTVLAHGNGVNDIRKKRTTWDKLWTCGCGKQSSLRTCPIGVKIRLRTKFYV